MSFQPKAIKLTKSETAGVNRLMKMLTWCRPHGSESEKRWVETFIDPFFEHKNVSGAHVDDIGNRWILVGDTPTTMFTAHTDTVHHNPGEQQVVRTGYTIHLPAGSASNCLGADDTAGCWLLTRMIQAGVPGLYAFFRGEERGGVGSSWAASNVTDAIKGIQRCISFDRRGTYSVITHQGYGGRCCSDAFAEALASQLCDDELMYMPDDTGVFTDSANFVDLIPECTNLSVGYDHEHTEKETLDVQHLVSLARRVVHVQWDELPTERDPSVCEAPAWDTQRDDSLHGGYLSRWSLSQMSARQVNDMTYDELIDLIERSDPVETAELIFNLAYEAMHPRYDQ